METTQILVIFLSILDLCHTSIGKCTKQDFVDICVNGDVYSEYQLDAGIPFVQIKGDGSCQKKLHYYNLKPRSIEPTSCNWICYPMDINQHGICERDVPVTPTLTTEPITVSVVTSIINPTSTMSIITQSMHSSVPVVTSINPTSTMSSITPSMHSSVPVATSINPTSTMSSITPSMHSMTSTTSVTNVTTISPPMTTISSTDVTRVYMLWGIMSTIVLCVLGFLAVIYICKNKIMRCIRPRGMYTEIPSSESIQLSFMTPSPPYYPSPPPSPPHTPSPPPPPLSSTPRLPRHANIEEDPEPIAKRTRGSL